MAGEYPEITESNRELLERVITDLHDATRKLDAQGKQVAAIHAAFEEFRPLLEQFRSPLAASLAGRRARRTNGRAEVQ